MEWGIIHCSSDTLKSEENRKQGKKHGSKLSESSKDFSVGFALNQGWKDQDEEFAITKVAKYLAENSTYSYIVRVTGIKLYTISLILKVFRS